MTMFSVLKTDGSSAPEVEGSAFAAAEFIALYPQFDDGELTGDELFSAWIRRVVDTENVVVAYGDNAHPVSLQGGNIVATINNKLVKLRLKTDEDSFQKKKALMIVPENQPTVNSQYLVDAVARIKAEPNATKAQAFLLGTILLKRCR
jgi:hypothetical protein